MTMTDHDIQRMKDLAAKLHFAGVDPTTAEGLFDLACRLETELDVRTAEAQSNAIELNLSQARQLVEFFGGDDAQVTVADWSRSTKAHDGPGIYAYIADYPEEGSIRLAP